MSFSMSRSESNAMSLKPTSDVSTTTAQIISTVRHDARVLPSATRPRAFTSQATTDVVNASTHFAGDAQYKKTHPNALCVTSAVTSNINELCTLAFLENQNGESVCAWRGNYVVSMDNDNLPVNGKIKECSKTKDPNAVCVPDGTVAVPCGTDINGGVNVGGGNYSMTPSWIAVPKSEAQNLLNGYVGCYSPQDNDTNKRYAYTKTSNFQVAYSNPNHP